MAPLAVALALLAASAAYLAWGGVDKPPQPPPVETAAVTPAPPAATMATPAQPPAAQPRVAVEPTAPVAAPLSPQPPAPRIARQRDPNGDQTADLADYVNEGERPTMAEVIERLRANGVTGGLAAFQPPGTRPPLVGLAVPEDFALPPGYVRHYQATDDGQRIEPILMFSPQAAGLLDSAGRPVTMPDDRVVPPELAPPGMPIRPIAIPPPAGTARPGR